MADFFIRRPIVAMVIAILTVIVGLISLKRLPISEYPPVSPTMIQVTTTYRGAAAEAVMESVATPIESKVNGVDKLLYMQSYSANDGKLTLNAYFDVGTDVDIMQVNAQNRVGQADAQLPDAVKREGVVVNRSSPDILMVVGLYSPKSTYDAVFLGNYCDINLVDAIKRVRGVGDVKNFTAQDYSMRVWLRPDKLAVLGITPSDIQNAIKEQNAQSPAGRIGAEPAPPGQEMQFNVRALGLLKDPKEFEEIIIRSNPDGSQVKIKDVGRVELGAQTYDLRGRFNQPGKQSAAGALGIFLAPGANAIETADNVKKILEDAKARFPPDMAYDVVMDSTLPIKASMEEIVHTLFEAVVLVLIVVYLFLQSFRATIIPMCYGARLAARRVHHVPGAGLQRERADDVRPGAGHRHRGGRRHRRGRGRATSPRARQGTRGGDPAGDEGSVRAGGGHRFGAVRRVRAGGVHGRRDRPALQPVRPHHRRRGGLLGDQRADAQPRLVRLDAQEADAGTQARSRSSSNCSTGSSTG